MNKKEKLNLKQVFFLISFSGSASVFEEAFQWILLWQIFEEKK